MIKWKQQMRELATGKVLGRRNANEPRFTEGRAWPSHSAACCSTVWPVRSSGGQCQHLRQRPVQTLSPGRETEGWERGRSLLFIVYILFHLLILCHMPTHYSFKYSITFYLRKRSQLQEKRPHPPIQINRLPQPGAPWSEALPIPERGCAVGTPRPRQGVTPRLTRSNEN